MENTTGQKMELNILTPRGVKFERQADFISMRAMDGDLGILPNHAPMTAVLGDGILKIVNDGQEEKMALFEGLVEVSDNVVNIYTTIAQRPEEIDIERARREKEDARANLQEEIDEAMVNACMLQIRRSLVRLEVGVHSSDEGYFEDRDQDLTEEDEEE